MTAATRAQASTVRRGERRPLSSLAAVSSRPRRWTPAEIALVEEAAERTWTAMERARSEAALREREERLSTVLGGMTEGFGLLAPDFTILEHNAPARVVMQITTQTPMTYDDGCEGFTSGSYETRIVGSPTEGIHVVYSACEGHYEPIGAGTL